jgi:hypothetical protein
MKEIKGLTLKEIAAILHIPENTAKVRMFRTGIEPLFRGALYPLDTPDRIREAPMGRPKKAKPGAPAKAGKKPETNPRT